MKKKLGIGLILCLMALLFTSCGEILSVVTLDKNGKKVVNNYTSMFGDTVYDETVSFKSWRDSNIFGENNSINMDELLFKIENKKENIVVLGDKNAAIELCFFDGGYKYTLYTSMDSMDDLDDGMDDFTNSLIDEANSLLDF